VSASKKKTAKNISSIRDQLNAAGIATKAVRWAKFKEHTKFKDQAR